MSIVKRKVIGGPLDGQTLTVMHSVKYYRAQKFEHEMGELVLKYHKYALNEAGGFIYKGKG